MSSRIFNPSMSRRTLIAGLAGLSAAGVLAGCSNDDSSSSAGSSSGSASGATFKIGGIGPTTGAAAIYGNAVKNGAQIAVDEINAEGGDIQFELNFQDDENDAERSVNAYNNLKDWGMQILMGTVTTTPCVAVSSETNADNMFQITPSGSSTDVIGGQPDADGNISTPRKENVFQMCFTDPNQGAASAQYISEQALGTKIAIIYNNSDTYSTGIYNSFKAEAEADGLEIVSETTFTDDSATDFSVQLNDAKNAGADLVFLPIYYTPISLILTQANQMGYAPKWFGVDGMDGLLTVEGFDTSLAEGCMLLTPFVATAEDEATQDFVAKFEEVASETPNQFAADAYDCIYALKSALEQAGVTPDTDYSDICDALVEVFTSGDFSFTGLTTAGEAATWSDTGEISKQPMGMVIQDGVYMPLDA
ncbi:ABC transporter substrate-binding protein [Collinsella ihumii]|uniref:ABC transporter substrate-binding protein n=1 Tax=Collinsella ihumii TaxID=1720204 RepID=A0A921LSS4_9ACTN|nr:ABC transporter substrate-binding protein [Collinsella ihumii]MDN0055231.1 ABC transporter substrate-binding protein [Collinsella ihumii]HJG30508.1 ABC transporter substrate-binding protein [Collinsella ihumii]